MNIQIHLRPTITASAAIDAIRQRAVIREHGALTPLRLLGLEDRYQARLDWRKRTGRPIPVADSAALEGFRKEIAGRSKIEMEIAREEFRRRNKFWTYFPDEGPVRRELYPRHMEVVSYTKEDDEIMMMAANKVGKTQLGAYCVTAWATGRYPSWWPGRVFEDPIIAWVCNKTAKDVRDINEAELLGPTGNDSERGTGMLPGHMIGKCTPKTGTPHAFEFIQVEHVSGLWSTIVSKSYDQGREAFQGRNIPVIWNDEEVPKDVADEEKLRIMTVSGVILYTYTPVLGLTEFTQEFMEQAGLSIEAMREREEELSAE